MLISPTSSTLIADHNNLITTFTASSCTNLDMSWDWVTRTTIWTVVAIMNSVISDLDHIADDDIAGAAYLYGIKLSVGVVTSFVGQPVSYQISTNIPPVSYEVTGLPSGLTFDSKSGVISGTFTLSGEPVEQAEVTVHGLRSTASDTLFLEPFADPPLDLRANYYFRANDFAADKTRNRVYAAVSDPPGLAVIDTTSLKLLKTIPLEIEPFALATSSDGNTIFAAEYDFSSYTGTIGVIDLKTLATLPDLARCPSVAQALRRRPENRLFAAASSQASIAQIDTVTGRITYPGLNMTDAKLILSPDRKILYGQAENVPLFSYDISGSSPILLRSLPNTTTIPVVGFQVSQDGSFILANGFYSNQALKLSAADFQSVLGKYVIPGAEESGGDVSSGEWAETFPLTIHWF